MAKRIRKHKTGKLVVRSGFEAKVVEQLRKQKIKFEYENLKLKYTVPEKQHTYTPDIELKASGIILEIKGRLTSADRAKMQHVKKANPDLDIRFVFMKNNPIRKGSKTTYGVWADKNGFPWCVKEVPEEWLN